MSLFVPDTQESVKVCNEADIEWKHLNRPRGADDVTIMSWNINGLSSIESLLGGKVLVNQHINSLSDLLHTFNCDIICFQETKLVRSALKESQAIPSGFDGYFAISSVGKGYSGVVTYCRNDISNDRRAFVLPRDAYDSLVSVALAVAPSLESVYGEDLLEAELRDFDREGRLVVTIHGERVRVALFNVYFPNSGSTDERLLFKRRFNQAVRSLAMYFLEKKGMQVILLGDFNAQAGDLDSCDSEALMKIFKREMRSREKKEKSNTMIQRTLSWTQSSIASLEEPVANADDNKPSVSLTTAATETTTDADMGNNDAVGSVVDALLNTQPTSEWMRSLLVDSCEEAVGQEALKSSDSAEAAPNPGPFVDLFRRLYPSQEGCFTCWNTKLNCREANLGRRIDYVLVSSGLFAKPSVPSDTVSKAVPEGVVDAAVQQDVLGSDHCPVSVCISGAVLGPFSRNDEERPLPSLCARLSQSYKHTQTTIGAFFSKAVPAPHDAPVKRKDPPPTVANLDLSTKRKQSGITTFASFQTNPRVSSSPSSSSSSSTTTTATSSTSLPSSTLRPRQASTTKNVMAPNRGLKRKKSNGPRGSGPNLLVNYFNPVARPGSSGATSARRETPNDTTSSREEKSQTQTTGTTTTHDHHKSAESWQKLFGSQQDKIPFCTEHCKRCKLLRTNKKGPNQGRFSLGLSNLFLFLLWFLPLESLCSVNRPLQRYELLTCGAFRPISIICFVF